MPRVRKPGPEETRAGTGQMQTVPRFMAITTTAETLFALDIHGRVWELAVERWGERWNRVTGQVAPKGWEDPLAGRKIP